MKKLLLFSLLFTLFGCSLIEVGKFDDNREVLHNKGNDICQTKPDHCLPNSNIPW